MSRLFTYSLLSALACGCLSDSPSSEETPKHAEDGAVVVAEPMTDDLKEKVKFEIRLMTKGDESLIEQRGVYILEADRKKRSAPTAEERAKIDAELKHTLAGLNAAAMSGRKWEIENVCKRYSITREQFMEVLEEFEAEQDKVLRNPD